MSLRSYDAPRRRAVATEFVARGADGTTVVLRLVGPTLVIVVKSSCEGCRRVLDADPDQWGVPAVALCDDVVTALEYESAALVPLIAPEWLVASGVRSAPFYLVVGERGEVLAEGMPFDAAHLAGELARVR